jgi:hypothetical protein
MRWGLPRPVGRGERPEIRGKGEGNEAVLGAVARLDASRGTDVRIGGISDGVVHGCVLANGQLRVIDNATSDCRGNETPLDWNQTRPVGATGPTGPTGDTGAPGASSGVQTRAPGGVDFGATGTPVVSLTLPAGNWMLMGHAEMIAGAGLASGRCFVATDSGSGPPSDFQTSEPNRPVVAFQSGVSLAVPKTVNVLCEVISGTGPIIAFNRTLMRYRSRR